MQELAWLLEPIRIWLEGGSWEDVSRSPGFVLLMVSIAMLVPSTLIFIGISGWDQWRGSPLAFRLGVAEDPHDNWVERARDLDKDGNPDF